MIAGRTEEEVYRTVGLPYIEPELREDRGELRAAAEGKLPRLVRSEDFRGDLHAHTTESDGRYTALEMAEAARARGYEYLAVTDHSKQVKIAHGLDEKRLAKAIKAIDKINAKLAGFTLLKSIELDILADGTLDLPDGILDELDLVVCSVHYNFKLSKEKQTERVIRAMDNPRVNVIGHPTGRLINERPPTRSTSRRSCGRRSSEAASSSSTPTRTGSTSTTSTARWPRRWGSRWPCRPTPTARTTWT